MDVLDDIRARLDASEEPVKPSHTGGEKGPRALPIAPPMLSDAAVMAALAKDGERRLKARSTAV